MIVSVYRIVGASPQSQHSQQPQLNLLLVNQLSANVELIKNCWSTIHIQI